MKITLTAEWQKIPVRGDIDADYRLQIANVDVWVAWRADAMSWDMYVNDSKGSVTGASRHHANSNIPLDSSEARALYDWAKADAEAAVIEFLASNGDPN